MKNSKPSFSTDYVLQMERNTFVISVTFGGLQQLQSKRKILCSCAIFSRDQYLSLGSAPTSLERYGLRLTLTSARTKHQPQPLKGYDLSKLVVWYSSSKLTSGALATDGNLTSVDRSPDTIHYFSGLEAEQHLNRIEVTSVACPQNLNL